MVTITGSHIFSDTFFRPKPTRRFRLLILDEPINGLDPEGIKEIRDVILRLNRERGVTFLISSHLLDELAKVVTKYGILSGGVLQEEITAKQLEERCRSGLKITVDNIAKALSVLEGRIGRSNIGIAGRSLILQSDTEYSTRRANFRKICKGDPG